MKLKENLHKTLVPAGKKTMLVALEQKNRPMNHLLPFIKQLPEGYSEGVYKTAKYGISKQTFNEGKSFKVFARELAGKDFISLNYYITSTQELLKPCEMPEKKVIDFLKNVQLLE